MSDEERSSKLSRDLEWWAKESKILGIIGYLEGIADVSSNQKVFDALQRPIVLLKELIGAKEE